MNCDHWQELILDRERLEPAERERLDRHLAECAGCRAWALALAEVESVLASQLRTELQASALRPRIERAVAHERIWVDGLPEMLEALGWSAVGVLAMAGLLLWSNWVDWRLWLAAACTLTGSLVWAVRALRNELPEARHPVSPERKS
jgi:predicted anti-sigma-YlaC factor YlaD